MLVRDPVHGDITLSPIEAALLHDVTDVPFGHTLEDERCLFPRHDKGARLTRLFDGALGDGAARVALAVRFDDGHDPHRQGDQALRDVVSLHLGTPTDRQPTFPVFGVRFPV